MIVRFYQFSKRHKSTKIPGQTTPYIEREIKWKEDTKVTSPTILVSFEPIDYNYVYIPKWNRYYFINDCSTYSNTLWQVSLVEDVLATFRGAIGNTRCNILYTTGSNRTDIVDSRLPVRSTILSDHTQSAINGLTIIPENGTVGIILGINGKGSFGAYMMQNSNKIRSLLDGIDAFNGTLPSTLDVAKQLMYGGSASECLKSALGMPFVLDATKYSSKNAEQLRLGNYPCTDDNGNPILGYEINKPIGLYITEINIPWLSSDWKRVSLFTTIQMYLPFIGMLSLPATELQYDTTLIVQYSINITSGDIAVQIKGKQSGKIVCTSSGNCAVPVAYGATGINTSKLTSGVATGIGTAVSAIGAYASGGSTLALSGIIGGGLLSTSQQLIDALGGTGSGGAGLGGGASSGLDKVMHIWVIQKNLVVPQSNYVDMIGRPYMQVDLINNVGGFVQTDGAQFEDTYAYASEKQIINQMLDTGIYYE